MSDELRTQIYNNLNLRDTDELLDIWQANNTKEWSETAFNVIREILVKRGIDVPKQDKSVPGEVVDEEGRDDEEFTESELKIIDDENPPEFYDPFEVLKISGQIKWAAKILVVFYIVNQLMRYPSIKQNVDAYFVAATFQTAVFQSLESIVVVATMIVLIALEATVIYFMLIGLSHILKILMEMEFNSRK